MIVWYEVHAPGHERAENAFRFDLPEAEPYAYSSEEAAVAAAQTYVDEDGEAVEFVIERHVEEVTEVVARTFTPTPEEVPSA